MSFRTAYGYAHSENGWRMCNRDECVTVPGPYMNTAPLRRGAPEVILGAWARWYHENVKAITSPVWGWSNTNDVANSNHLSGTALDIDAPSLPWGRRVMPRDRIAKVRHGLTLFPEVFWGADWGRADEMHFQMKYREGDPRNDAGVRRILGAPPAPAPAPTPAPAPSSGRPVIRLGATGSAVRDLQARLNRDYPAYSRLVVDGDFGPATDRVVREFQRRAGLGVDGIVGPATWGRLGL